MPNILEINNLRVQFNTDEGVITALDGVSFTLAKGQSLGLVGESGSGKSVTSKCIMQLHASNARVSGDIFFHTEAGEVLNAVKTDSARERTILRGGEVAMIFQEPMASFAPAMTIGGQMVEALRLHQNISKKEAKTIAIDMLDKVGISDAARRFKQYAFELSGGMRQRAMIAMALSTKPRLLIADEPTTALDVTIQAQVLDLMRDLRAEMGMSMIFISHDLGVIRQVADVVAVMYLGTIVEFGKVEDVIHNPQHPYTKGLITSLPSLKDFDAPLQPVPGDIPSLLERPSGCAFHTRCPQVFAPCADTKPALQRINAQHEATCFLLTEDNSEATTPTAERGKSA